jgi:streptogramin lyase
MEGRLAFLVTAAKGSQRWLLAGLTGVCLVAQADGFVDLVLRNAGETAFSGLFQFDPDSQTRTQTTDVNVPAVYEFRFTYVGVDRDTVRLRSTRAPGGWTVRCFDELAGGQDISRSVVSSEGYAWPDVVSGATRDFRIEVMPGPGAAGGQMNEVGVRVWPESQPQRSDGARAFTACLVRQQADLLIRRDFDLRYLGDNLYNLSGVAQTKRQETEPDRVAVYFMMLANDGNLTDHFRVSGSGGDEAWRVRYFDAPFAGLDVTDMVTGDGWLSPPMVLNETRELRLEVSGPASVQGVSVSQVYVRAAPVGEPTRTDTVKAVTAIIPDSSVPQGALYTQDADFEKGVLAGVTFTIVPDQLQCSVEPVTLPYLWVPNSNEGTVSKVDTRTGRELARYRTGPDSVADQPVNGNPSRTTIDQLGNCWVANRRTGTAVKIGLWEHGQYVDRNGDGVIQTSHDRNGDGDITGDELLPWGQDECVLFEVVLLLDQEGTFVPGTFNGTYADDDHRPGPRGVAVDAAGDVWLGTYGTSRFYHVAGTTGRIRRIIDFSSVAHTSYGAVIDANGILWSSGLYHNNVLRLDPADGSFTTVDLGHTVYGLGLDRSNHLFVAGWSSTKLTRLDVLTGLKDWTVEGGYQSRGVAVTEDGDVWTADSGPGTVTRWSNDGVLKTSIPVGRTPTGVSVDAAGKVWVVNYGDEYIKRIDPVADRIDLEHRIPGGYHYGYSDMTGIISRTTTTRLGVWTLIHDSHFPGATWGTVSWTAAVPPGTRLQVCVRSSADRREWSGWEIVTNGVPLQATPPGKYLEVEATFQALEGDRSRSPVLYDLTVTPADAELDRPALRLRAVEVGEVELSWDAGVAGVVLEFTESLPGIWQAVPGAAAPPYRSRIEIRAPTRFYRLCVRAGQTVRDAVQPPR